MERGPSVEYKCTKQRSKISAAPEQSSASNYNVVQIILKSRRGQINCCNTIYRIWPWISMTRKRTSIIRNMVDVNLQRNSSHFLGCPFEALVSLLPVTDSRCLLCLSSKSLIPFCTESIHRSTSLRKFVLFCLMWRDIGVESGWTRGAPWCCSPTGVANDMVGPS